jgi:hypothetical protein
MSDPVENVLRAKLGPAEFEAWQKRRAAQVAAQNAGAQSLEEMLRALMAQGCSVEIEISGKRSRRW